jgi:hypothetical protein
MVPPWQRARDARIYNLTPEELAEIDPVRLRPHPHEFLLYYDI